MSISASLNVQIAALKSRIDSVATTATPEELMYLSKAIDSITGQVSVMDIVELSEQKLNEIDNAFTDKVDATITLLANKESQAVSSIDDAKNVALATLNPVNFSLAAVYAAALTL